MPMPDFSKSIASGKTRIENFLGKEIPGIEDALQDYYEAYFIAQMSDVNRIMYAEQRQARETLVKFLAGRGVPEDKAKNIPIS